MTTFFTSQNLSFVLAVSLSLLFPFLLNFLLPSPPLRSPALSFEVFVVAAKAAIGHRGACSCA